MLNKIMEMASYSGLKQFEALEKVATNVANINTPGYKVQRFDQYLMADGRLNGVTRQDFSAGPVMITKKEMDLAIDGPGFFPVTQNDGTVAYTRDGSFMKNADGLLITKNGDVVGQGITIPFEYDKLFFRPNGDVEVIKKGEISATKIDHIDLVSFPNPEGLKSIGENKLVQTGQSGEPRPIETDIKQGALERSNVHVFTQVDHVLRLNASVISNLRLIKFSDELFRQSANLRQ